MSDLNDFTILGFKYAENTNVTLTPTQGQRYVSFLRLIDGQFRWFQILEAHHDSNKLYASVAGIPTGSWVAMDLEDIGLEANGFKTTGAAVQDDKVVAQKWIGSGWMNQEDSTNPKILIACGNGNDVFQFTKLNKYPTTLSDILSHLPSQHNFDIIIPIVQPKRVVSEKGVYFVG
jgi:hypothetical protein